MAKNEFGATLWTGLKFILANIISSLLTLLVYIFLLLLGISFAQPAIMWLLFIIYIVSLIFIGGWVARNLFGWK